MLDGKAFFAYNGYAIFQSEEVYLHENDFPAQEEIQIQSSRFPCKNEHKGRKKGSGSKKSKGKKGSLCLIEQYQLS